MLNIAGELRNQGHTCITVCAPGRSMAHDVQDNLFVGGRISKNIHIALGWLTGLQGCFSVISTIKILSRISRENIDIIHLHNLHNCYINIPLLFHYIKKKKIPVVWTLHDCWAFTGHCAYFDMANCDKWKSDCHKCPQYKKYPQTAVDHVRTMYKLKKKWFSGVDNLTIVTPSVWLSKCVEQSFLSGYERVAINNGINLSAFDSAACKTEETDRLRGKKVVLGVAHDWDARKGLDVFIELEKMLPQDYQIILVGTNEKIDSSLPPDIISVHRTRNVQKLAELYTLADVFVNPTREDVLGLVNIEALACGTPVVSFDSGGSPECFDGTCGVVVPKNDIGKLKEGIELVCTKRPYSAEACRTFASRFSKEEMCTNYIHLYERILHCGNESTVSKSAQMY